MIFLTAVDISTYSHAEAVYRGIKAKAFIMLGIDNPPCINLETNSSSREALGTINIAVVVDKLLSRLALLEYESFIN